MIQRRAYIKRSSPPKRTRIERSNRAFDFSSGEPAARGRLRRKPLTFNQSRDQSLLRMRKRIVMARDPICRVCKRRPSFDDMHLIARGARKVRYDPENGMGGCRLCHDYYTKRPRAWKRWWRNELGEERANRLLAIASNPNKKVDYDETRKMLRGIMRAEL